MMRAQIIVVDDRALVDDGENRAGPILAEALEELGCEVATVMVGQADDQVRPALEAAVVDADVVVTTGGTGFRPRDVVVDLTRALGMVEFPGFGEEIRRRGASNTSAALLSRPSAGVVTRAGRRVLVVNSPSSRGGARDVADLLGELWPHLARELQGSERS